MKRLIPNTITCCNLLSGTLAVIFACDGLFTAALIAILAGAVFDFFDGMTARALHVNNPIGKELDSLADVITFGLAPSVMLMQAIRLGTANSNYDWGWWSATALIMAAFSAIRLAKFNIDTRQTNSFIGLATPANAIFWASYIAAIPDVASFGQIAPCCLLLGMALSCYLLICEIPFFSLKFHDLTWRNNRVRYIFLIGCILIVALFVVAAIHNAKYNYIALSGAGIIVWYIIANLLLAVTSKAA